MNSNATPSSGFSFGSNTGTPGSSGNTGGFNFGSTNPGGFSFSTPSTNTAAPVFGSAATNPPTFGTTGSVLGTAKPVTTNTGLQFGTANPTPSTQAVFGTPASTTFGGVQATAQNTVGIGGQSNTQPSGLFSAAPSGLFSAAPSSAPSGMFGTAQRTTQKSGLNSSTGLFSGVMASAGGGPSLFQQKPPPNTGGSTTTFGGVQATAQNTAGIGGQSNTQPSGLFSAASSAPNGMFGTPQKTTQKSGLTSSTGLFSGVMVPAGGGPSLFQQKPPPNTGGSTTLFSGAAPPQSNPSFNFGSLTQNSKVNFGTATQETQASTTATAVSSFGSPSSILGSQSALAFRSQGTGPTTKAGISFSASSLASSAGNAQGTTTTSGGMAMTKPGFTLGGAGMPGTTAQAGGTGFKLGGATQGTTAAPSITGAATGTTFGGVAPQKTGPTFNLGGTGTSVATTQGGGFKLGSGATPATTSQTINGFKLGTGNTPATTQANLAASAATTAGFSFGTTTATAPTTTQPMQNLALGQSTTGFNFTGQLGGQAKTTATTTPASTTAKSGLTGTNTNLVFAAKVGTPLQGTRSIQPTTTTATTKPALTIPQTSTSTTTTGFTLGSSGLPTTTTTASGFKLPTATSSTTATAGTTTTLSTEKYTYKQLEEQVNKWNIEVEEMERAFLEQAAQVNVADRELMENGEKIAVLHSEVERAKADQERLDQELDFLVSQQNELEDLLQPLEESVKQHSLEHNQEPDRERERIYRMAEKCDGQLKGMVQDLREIIDYLNSTNASQQQQDNPVIQIAKILNVHMDSLQWIDQNSALLQKRVDEIARLNELRRRDHERSFRLGFD